MQRESSKSSKTRKPLLETVAEHEEGLLNQVSATEDEGREIVEAARAQAAESLVEAHRKLEIELAELRCKAMEERESVRLNIEQATAEKVRAIHEDSMDKRSAVVEEILDLLLPEGYRRGIPQSSD